MGTEKGQASGDTAVLLVAHGSRVSESNAEIESLANRLAAVLGPGCTVHHAFLEMVEPSIGGAIDALAGSGTGHIMVLPYFLSAGRHVREDIPAIIRAARARHPGLIVDMTGHFGAEDRVPELLSAMVSARIES